MGIWPSLAIRRASRRRSGNVLSNAAKYTERGGHITLSAARERDGGGDPDQRQRHRHSAPELMPMIFNLFTQLDRTSGPAQSGLGIGLALVQRLVEMHGGSVSARSEGPRQGQRVFDPSPVFIRETVESGQPIQQRSALEQSMTNAEGRRPHTTPHPRGRR